MFAFYHRSSICHVGARIGCAGKRLTEIVMTWSDHMSRAHTAELVSCVLLMCAACVHTCVCLIPALHHTTLYCTEPHCTTHIRSWSMECWRPCRIWAFTPCWVPCWAASSCRSSGSIMDFNTSTHSMSSQCSRYLLHTSHTHGVV
jgi:hypothetical protein